MSLLALRKMNTPNTRKILVNHLRIRYAGHHMKKEHSTSNIVLKANLSLKYALAIKSQALMQRSGKRTREFWQPKIPVTNNISSQLR